MAIQSIGSFNYVTTIHGRPGIVVQISGEEF